MKRISLRRISKKKQKGLMTKPTSLPESGDSSLVDHDSPALTSDDQPSDDAAMQLQTPQRLIRGKQRSKRRQLRQYINAMSPISKRKDSVEKLAEAETRQAIGFGLLQLEELITDEETGHLRVRSELEDMETSSRVGRPQKRSLGSPSYLVSSSEEFGYVSREVNDSNTEKDRRSMVTSYGSPCKVLIKAHSVDMEDVTTVVRTNPEKAIALNTKVNNTGKSGELIKQQSLPESATYFVEKSLVGQYKKQTHKSPRKQLKTSRAYKSVEVLPDYVRQHNVAKKSGKCDVNYKDVINANAAMKKKKRNLLKNILFSSHPPLTSQSSRSQENLLPLVNEPISSLNQIQVKRKVRADRRYRSQETLLDPETDLHQLKKRYFKSVDDLTDDVNNLFPQHTFMTQQSMVKTMKFEDENRKSIGETNFISNKEKPSIRKRHSPLPIEAVVKINNYPNKKTTSAENGNTSKTMTSSKKVTKFEQQIRHNRASTNTKLNSLLLSPEKQSVEEDDTPHEDSFVDVIMHDEKLNDVDTAQASEEEAEDQDQWKTPRQGDEHLQIPLGRDFIPKPHHTKKENFLSPVKQRLGTIFPSPKKSPKFLKTLVGLNSEPARVERSKSALTVEQQKNKSKMKRKRNKTLENYDKVEDSEDDNVFECSTSVDEIANYRERKKFSQKNSARQHRHSNRISQTFTNIFKSPTYSKSKVLELDLDLILNQVKEETSKDVISPCDDDVEKIRSERRARIAKIEEEKRKHEEEIRKLELEAYKIKMMEEAEAKMTRRGRDKSERVELTIRGAFVVSSDSDDYSSPPTTRSPNKVMMQMKRRFSSMKRRSALKRYNLDGYSVEQTSWKRKKTSKIRRAVSLKTDRHLHGKSELRSPQKILEDFLTHEGKLKSSSPNVTKKDGSNNPDEGWLAITHTTDLRKPPQITVYQQKSRGSKSLIKQMSFQPSNDSIRIPTLGVTKSDDEKNKKQQKMNLKSLSRRNNGISTDVMPRRRLFGRNSLLASDWDKVTDFGGMTHRRVNSAIDSTSQTCDQTVFHSARARSTSTLSDHYDVRRTNSQKEKRSRISDVNAQILGKELVVQMFDWSERSSLRNDSIDDDYVEMKQIQPPTVIIDDLEQKTEANAVEDNTPLEQKTEAIVMTKTETIVVEDTTPLGQKSEVVVMDDTPSPETNKDENKLGIRQTDGGRKREEYKTRSPAKVLSGIFSKIIYGSPGKEGGLLRRGSSLRKSRKEASSLPSTPKTEKNRKLEKSKKATDSKKHSLLVPGQENLSLSLQNLATFDNLPNDDLRQQSHAHGDVIKDAAVQRIPEASEHQQTKQKTQIKATTTQKAEDSTYVEMKGHLDTEYIDDPTAKSLKNYDSVKTSIPTMLMETAEESDYSPASKFCTLSVFSKFAPEAATNHEDAPPNRLEDSYQGDDFASPKTNQDERSSRLTTQKPFILANNRLTRRTDRTIPVTLQVKVTDRRNAQQLSQRDNDVIHNKVPKGRQSKSGTEVPNQFDYEGYFQGGGVSIESRRDYVNENWKNFYDITGHDVKEAQLSPRRLRQMHDNQSMLMTRLLGGQKEAFISDVTKTSSKAKSKRPTSMESALSELMQGVRISNRENFETKSYKKEMYKEVVKVEHGQCSLSVPYIAVEKLPVSSLYENGDIYASDSKGECIDVYSARGQHKTTLNVPGKPSSVVASESGHVLCTSYTTGQVYVIDVVGGGILRKIGHIEHSRHPRYVTMHPDNRAFMTSDIRFLGNWNINLFDLRTGSLSLSIAPSSYEDIRVKWPGFLAFRQGTDQLYVSDSESNCLFVYDLRKASRPVFQIGEEGTGDGELCNPCGVTYIPGGALTLDSTQRGPVVVADWGNNRISAFDAITGQFEGHVIDDGGQTKDKIVQTPYDITTDVRGWIYMTESRTKNIKVFRPT